MLKISQIKIKKIAYTLKKGGVVALSTDTVLGLSVLPNKTESIKKLIAIKKRPKKLGFIVLTPKDVSVKKFISDNLSEDELSLLFKKNDKPITWLVPANKNINPLVVGKYIKNSTVAIRITDNPIITNICKIINSPIISTSANIHKKSTIGSKRQLQVFFKNNIDDFLIYSSNNKPSTIKNLLTNDIIRY